MTTHHPASQWVAQTNTRNARTTRRAEAAAELLVALAIAAGLVWALLAWATPCADATLCLATAAIPARPWWLQRGLLRLRALYLRALIRWAQADLEFQARQERIAQREIEHLPLLRQSTRQHIEELECQLIDCELAQRTR